MTTSFGRSLLLDDGDLVVTAGQLREVESVANLSQALTLRVLTPFGSDPFNTGYGLDIGRIFTGPNPLSVAQQLVQLNLVRTLGTDPRVRDVRQVVFDDAQDQDRRVWTVRVELDTVAGDPLTLLVDVGV
ncbi:hypothetical protein OG787_01490 [Streptomyces sp. NBC_00075]|uniref:IraD/Gp25-like domain-containing protein n=1 Tax=Streptomyces sp. NBC_00093 TaxID=2975649 RepID=A0AAU1ZQH9_9ACTN